MTAMKGLIALPVWVFLFGCTGNGADPLRVALESGAPHFATRIENPSQEYVATEVRTLAGPIQMSGEWGKRFDNVMLDLVDQSGNEAYACVVNPGVKITIAGGEQTIRFLICFECRVILVLDSNGNKVKELSFASRHAELGELVIEAFPADTKLADVINRKVPTS